MHRVAIFTDPECRCCQRRSPRASGTYLWMILLGLGQGAAISLAMLFIVLRAADSRHAAQLSSMAQGVGYLSPPPGLSPWAPFTS
ncbi:hypothetical protein [Microtetraspora sp. NBRC 13810]|uniref:hypothetical protein n=1 Tax=Microtetraspora sp. NBRC 13810 TaxID=3030990 RepID=UPI0025562146|nr:hypothetical protein [Microtetraspora sp. NBRC 13810]